MAAAAASGDLAAQNKLGLAYWSECNEKLAESWLARAARAGSAQGASNLGQFLLLRCEARSLVDFVSWMAPKTTEEEKRWNAFFEKRRANAPKEIESAIYWLSRASDAGAIDASLALWAVYWRGYAGSTDWSQAASFCERVPDSIAGAAKHELLADVYARGRPGLPANVGKAIEHLRVAATAGSLGSQVMLGRFLLDSGNGTQDVEEAVYWLRIAHLRKSEAAAALLQDVEPKLTPEQYGEIRRRVEAAPVSVWGH